MSHESKLALSFLSPTQILQIDQALTEVGEYGEVRLVVQRGELRYINNLVSHKVVENNNSKRSDASKP